MGSQVHSGDTTVFLKPVKKPSLGISSLFAEQEKRMAKEHKNLDESKEWSRGITKQFIQQLQNDNENLVKTLDRDREFMDKTFTEERIANQIKFEKLVDEIGDVDKSQIKLKAEFGIVKWLIGLMVLIILTQLLNSAFGG